jgi:hypothetical protein
MHEGDRTLSHLHRPPEHEEQRTLAREEVVAEVEQRGVTAADEQALLDVDGRGEAEAVPLGARDIAKRRQPSRSR